MSHIREIQIRGNIYGETVLCVLVTSRMDSCNELYTGLPLKTTQKLLQNAPTRLLAGVAFRTQMNSCIGCQFASRPNSRLAFKALNVVGPKYLKDCPLPYRPSLVLLFTKVVLPPSDIWDGGSLGEDIFMVALRMWNPFSTEVHLTALLCESLCPSL